MAKPFYELIRGFGGLSLEYSALTEADFTATAGSAYTPPERGTFRRIDVTRTLQLLMDAPGVIETFQTSAAELRLPANTITEATNDAGNGRLFFLKNSGTGNIVIKDYLGTTLWTAKRYSIVVVVGNDNNNWDFFFTAKNIDYSNVVSGLTSDNAQDAIDEIATTAAVSASPGFTWGASGNVTAGSYLQNDTVPSNTSGRLVPLTTGAIKEVFAAAENATTYSVDIQKRTGGTFTTLTTVTVTSARTGVFSVDQAVVKGDELAVRVSPSSANSPKNLVVGLIIKGSL